QERLSRTAVVVAGGREEVDAAVPVHLEIDEAGDRDTAARSAREAERDDPPALDVDVAGNELAPHESGLDPEPHPRTLCPVSAAVPVSHTRDASGVARWVMWRHAS